MVSHTVWTTPWKGDDARLEFLEFPGSSDIVDGKQFGQIVVGNAVKLRRVHEIVNSEIETRKCLRPLS
jgi:hypothetical protein